MPTKTTTGIQNLTLVFRSELSYKSCDRSEIEKWGKLMAAVDKTN